MTGMRWLERKLCQRKNKAGHGQLGLTDVPEMEVSVVVECMHRVQFDVASMRFVHDLSPYGSVFHECAVSSMSYLKAEHAFQVADSLSHDFPHV